MSGRPMLSNAWKTELSVFGYIRECQMKYQFYMNIAVGINKVILSYMPPPILKFDLYDKEWFKLEGDDEIITKKSTDSTCTGHFAYPQSYVGNKGFVKGIHFWSLKCQNVHDCYRYIGASTIRCEQYTKYGKDGPEYGWDDKWEKKKDQTHFIYVEGGYQHWKEKDIFTVKLDCNNWECFWYKNDKLHKKTSIEPNHGYFFIAQFCGAQAKYQSVETPDYEFK